MRRIIALLMFLTMASLGGVAFTEAQEPAARLSLAMQSMEGPPPAWRQQDPADSLYRAARTALNQDDYRRAAELFREIQGRFPRSEYAPDALYWEAFALYRSSGADNLGEALRALDAQRQRYPRAATRGDAGALATRIRGELARLGDSQAAERVTRDAARAAASCPDDNGVRTAALNALLQMDTEQAVPILRQVLARRDECSVPLREKAVFLLSQKRTPETENILLSVASNDPDPEVREQAVFWLSQVPTERAVEVLEEILRTSNDAGVREKVLFALSQHQSSRASQIVRSYAGQSDAPVELREKAIFWIGQQRSAENTAFLRDLYRRLSAPELKEKALFALSQMEGEGNERWLLEVALDRGEPIELRKKALFWVGQAGIPISELIDLYDRISGPEMREQIIFVLSQRGEPAAVDKLISIARGNSEPELREKAIFWLSQSNDPRAARALLDIINQE